MRPNDDARTPIIIRRTVVIIRVWTPVRVAVISRGRCGRNWRRRLLVHVEINALRNTIGFSEAVAGPEGPNLLELVGYDWERLDNILKVTEIVKGSVAVAKNLQVHGGVADVLSISLNSCARSRNLDENIVSNSSVWATLDAGGNGFTADEEAGQRRAAGKKQVLRFHIQQ